MAAIHGEAPKDIYVPKYARWVRGERLYVEGHLRGWTPPLYFRETDLQMDFGFERRARPDIHLGDSA